MYLSSMIYFLVAAIGLFIIVKIFSWPIKVLIRLLINGALGALVLWGINYFGGSFNIFVPINGVTSLIAGFLGIPGIIFLIIFNKF